MIFKKNSTPGNRENFARLSRAMRAAAWAALIFQIISGVSEGYGLKSFFGMYGGWFFGLVAAIVISASWEVAIRSLTVYSTGTAVKWFKRRLRLDWLELVGWVVKTGLLIVLVTFSAVVSKENLQLAFEADAGSVVSEKTESVDSYTVTESQRITTRYNQREKEITTRYNRQLAAKADQFDNAMKPVSTDLEYWKKMEQVKGKKYTSNIRRLEKRIGELKAEKAQEIAQLEDARSAALENIQSERDAELTGIAALGTSNRGTVMTWVFKYSKIWSIFAGLSVLAAVLLIIAVTIDRVLSEIEDDVTITDDYTEHSFFDEVAYYAYLKAVHPIRNRIREGINRAAKDRVQLEITTGAPPSQPTAVIHNQAPIGFSQPAQPAPHNRAPIGFTTSTTSTSQHQLPIGVAPVVQTPQPAPVVQAPRPPVVVEWEYNATADVPTTQEPDSQVDVKIKNGKALIRDKYGRAVECDLAKLQRRLSAWVAKKKAAVTTEQQEKCEAWIKFYADIIDKVKKM